MRAARTDKSVFSRWWWSIDRLTLAALVILIISGIVLVTAASPAVAEHHGLAPFYFVKHQVAMLVPTVAIMFAVSFLEQKTLWRVATVTLGATLVLMVLAILTGPEIKGATRWVSLGGFSLQPSEFAKPAFAIVSAWLMARSKQKKNFPGQQLAFAAYIAVLGLMLLEPDLGMSFVLSCIWGAQIFLSGLPLVYIVGIAGAGIIGLFGAYMFFPHVTSRVDRFLDPAAGDNYQVQKSLDAFANGGLFGKGPGHGEVKLTLPDAHADFIFAVAGEEFGMIAAVLLIALYAFIVIRCIMRVYKSEDLFVVLATAGLLVQFSLQSLIHMGSSLQLLPAKGMTLPFLSYGGSSLLSLGLAMGMLLALTRKRQTGRHHDS